jgi:hypothetical protein
MDSGHFDSLAKSLAQVTSRRQVLRGMAGGLVGALLGRASGAVAQPPACPDGLSHCGDFCFDWKSDRRHCGGCNIQCALDETCYLGVCTAATCTAGPIVCWGDAVDPRTDQRNCGQCGETCADGKRCLDCVCEAPDLNTGACRSQQLRLWLNAFLPGFIPGLTSMASVDGVSRAVFQMELPEGGSLVLLADRDPDPRFSQTPFSADLAAPGMAQLELGMGLLGMIGNTPEPRAGSIVQLREVGEDAYVTQCTRQLQAPLATCARLVESDGARAVYDVDCRWTVQRPNPPEAACGLDGQTFPPVRVQGQLEIERIDADRLVEIRFSALDEPESNARVSRFPAFEMYARLDDGNQVALFQRAPDDGWVGGSLVEVVDELGQQCGEEECQGVVARLGCGCGGQCINGKECFVDQSTGTQQCRWLDGYYVLAGDSAFQPSSNFVCADPRCPADAACADPCQDGYLRADGSVTVLVDDRVVYRSDPFGREIVPPIGFRARPGARVRVEGTDTSNTRQGLRFLSLSRVDGPFGRQTRELRPDTGNRFVSGSAGQTGIEIEIQQPRSTEGSTICCRDQGQQVCVDRMSSESHCGGCNHACADGMICLAGRCACPHPLIAVGDRCIDPSQDSQHCGPDLLDCTLEGLFCAQSSCVSQDCRDATRFQVCDGMCVSLEDAEHCGYFCETCRVPENGGARCTNGVCDIECNDGFLRCGNECVDPSLPQHCGQCDPCPVRPNATPTCDLVDGAFQCGQSCDSGFHDCWGECVSNFRTETCGSECSPCPPESPVCAVEASGVFAMCCPENATNCTFGCAYLWADVSNCGACGNTCGFNECCNGGVCGICDGCGGCPAGQVCLDGVCQDPPPPPPPPPPDCGCGFWDDVAQICVYKTCAPFEDEV